MSRKIGERRLKCENNKKRWENDWKNKKEYANYNKDIYYPNEAASVFAAFNPFGRSSTSKRIPEDCFMNPESPTGKDYCSPGIHNECTNIADHEQIMNQQKELFNQLKYPNSNQAMLLNAFTPPTIKELAKLKEERLRQIPFDTHSIGGRSRRRSKRRRQTRR